MKFPIFTYPDYSYTFLPFSQNLDPDSQKGILLMNQLVEIAEAGLAKLPFYALISGTSPNLIAARKRLLDAGSNRQIIFAKMPNEKPWKLAIFGVNEEKDARFVLPLQDSSSNIPDIPNTHQLVNFDPDSDTDYSFREKETSDLLRTQLRDLILVIPETVELSYCDLSIDPNF